jgi:hypothetical protein
MNFGRHWVRYEPNVCSDLEVSEYFVIVGLGEVGSENGEAAGAVYEVNK